jgi:hypothetical protein
MDWKGMDQSSKRYVTCGVGLFVLSVAVFLAWWTNHPAQFLGGGVGILGIIGLAVFADIGTTDGVRNAIAGSVVLMFIVTASLTLFSPTLQGVTTGDGSYSDDDAKIAEETTDVLVTALETGSAAPNTAQDGDATSEVVSAASDVAAPSDTVPTDILSLFRWVVVAVVGFYFASTTLEKLFPRHPEGRTSSSAGG